MSKKYKFKLAVISDEISQDPREIVAVGKEFGLAAVEIRSLWDRPPHELSKAQVTELRSILDDAGMRTCGIAAPFLKCDYGNKEQFGQHMEILKRCADLADKLGCDLIRGFTFGEHLELVDNYGPIIEKYAEVTPVLDTLDKRIVIENEHSTNTGTGKETSLFINKLNHPRVKIVWDAANCIYSPLGEKPFPAGYEMVKDQMIHVHIKDAQNLEGSEPECVPIGEGQVDWRGQFKALVDDGYDGYMSLETHWRPTSLSEEELNLPGGAKFSEGGEYASRICLKNIHAMLNEL